MSQSTLSHIRESQHSLLSKQQSNYQIQPFQIEPRTLTLDHVNQMIEHWDSFAKIQQKFSVWSLNFTFDKVLKIVPQQFYKAAIHYVFLKKLQILIKDFDQKDIIKRSMELKDIYKVQSLKGKFKGKRFDYLLIVTVKLIGFFLGSHTRDIIISQELQSQIYTMLVYVLLGTQVGQKTYPVLLQKYKKKPSLKYNRSSQISKCIILPTLQTKKNSNSQHHHKTAKTTAYSKKRIGRTVCRTGTQLFQEPAKIIEDHGYREMKQLLKVNLQVKQFIPKPKVKQSLDTVLSKTVDVDTKLNELEVAKSMQKSDMQHKKIFYTQMSSSLDLLRNNNSLNILQNHSLNIKPQKQAKFYQLKNKQDILKSSKSAHNLQQKLPLIQKPVITPQVYSYQAIVLKKKQPTYWKKVINEMKENHYENIEHFPPISAKMYFQPGELDDEVKRQSFSNSNMTKDENINHQDNYHGQYLTQKVTDMSATMIKQINMNQTQSKMLKSSPAENLSKKNSINTKNVLEQSKNQVNIVQYSKVATDSQIFKTQKGFLNVYSNKPIEYNSSKLKKKSHQQLKEMQKKFYEDCKVRQQKIQESYFC